MQTCTRELIAAWCLILGCLSRPKLVLEAQKGPGELLAPNALWRLEKVEKVGFDIPEGFSSRSSSIWQMTSVAEGRQSGSDQVILPLLCPLCLGCYQKMLAVRANWGTYLTYQSGPGCQVLPTFSAQPSVMGITGIPCPLPFLQSKGWASLPPDALPI